jgi:hypothetical protein
LRAAKTLLSGWRLQIVVWRFFSNSVMGRIVPPQLKGTRNNHTSKKV